jgi:hypothetical protein
MATLYYPNQTSAAPRAKQLTRTASQAQLAVSPFDEDSIVQINTSKYCDSPVIDWPPNNGCNDDTIDTRVILQPGTLVDRFGRLTGEFFSPVNEPFRKRSLKQIINKPECIKFYNKKYSKNNNYRATGTGDDWRLVNDYHVLRVLKDLNVVKCTAAPAFDQPGGATQYWVPKNFNNPFAMRKTDGTPDNYTIEDLIIRGDLMLLKKETYDPPDYEGGFIKRKSRRRKRRKGRKTRRSKR